MLQADGADTWVDMPEPFLDKNDNCYRDDLTDRPRLTPLGQIANTDLFNDVDGNNVFGVGRDGVGYSTSGGFVDPIKARLDAFAARIASGEILVPTRP